MLKTRLLLPLSLLVFASLACVTAERIVFGEAEPVAPVTEAETVPPVPDDPQPAPAQPDESYAESDCPDGDCVVACMEGLDSILYPSTANALRGRALASEAEEVTLVSYTVSGDELLYPEINPDVPSRWRSLQENSDAHQNLWRYYTALIPAEQRTYLNEFVVYTDGRDEGLAAVSQSLTDPARWDLMVDILDAEEPQYLTFTLIHEFGHLLTLNADQIEPNWQVFNNPDDPDIFYEESLKCPNYFAYEGCTNPDSYLNLFIDQFQYLRQN